MSEPNPLQPTVDRLALELAELRAELADACMERDRAQREARTWRRVALWIHNALQEKP